MLRVAINGYGRIGRSVLRALYESNARQWLQVVAINEPSEAKTIAHLTRYDSTHGRFPGIVELSENTLVVNGDSIQLYHQQHLFVIFQWLPCRSFFEKVLQQHVSNSPIVPSYHSLLVVLFHL